MRLAVITTHPIQYNAPFFRLLSEDDFFQVKVFYTLPQYAKKFYDLEFGREISWDIDLLQGYEYELVRNLSIRPNSKNFFGVINLDLVRRVENFGPDVILVYGWKFWSHLRVMRYFKSKGIKLLFRGDSHLLGVERENWRFKLKKQVLSWVYSFVDFALYVGTANKEYFKTFGLKDEQLIFVPHAVENERFLDRDGSYSKQARELREKLGFATQNVVFLYAGKFIEKKNLKVLIKAFKRVCLDRDDVGLVLVGDGQLKRELINLSAGCARIKFLPFANQSQMPVIYRLGDVFVLPSKLETWGLSVNEAMASSRAIVVSNRVGCSIDLVKENGLIFKYDDINQLSDIFRQFSKKMAIEMGQKSFEIIQNWTYAKGLENLIQACLSKC